MESLEKCVGDVAARFGLRYVVLFGSRAVGYAAEFSDWDLAVKVGRRMSFTELGRLYGELERCVSGRLDLLVLDWADPIAAWEALGRGRLIYHCGPDCLREYYWDAAEAFDKTADLEPLVKIVKNALARSRQ